VDLVDEENRVLALPNRGDQRLEAQLEVPSIARAGQQCSDVEGEDLRVAQALDDAPLADAQGEPLGQRRLAHARLAHEDRVVLPTPREDLDDAVQLLAAPDQRVELALGGPLAEVRAERRQRVRGHLAGLAAAGLEAGRRALGHLAFGAGGLRDAVGDVLEHVETRDALGAQQRHRVGVRLLEDRGDQVPRVDLRLLRPLAVSDGALKHAVEGQRLERLEGLVARHALQVLGEEALEGRLERTDLPARVAQDVEAPLVVEQRVEEMLDRHVGVPAHHGLAEGRLQGQMRLARDLAHSFSVPARSG
jgi:hypothetical protein